MRIALGNVVGVSAKTVHGCAWTRDGTLSCWGNNQFGQVGPASDNSKPTSPPVVVPGLAPIESATTGSAHSCAIANAHVYCWGGNFAGQIGDGVVGDLDHPQRDPVEAVVGESVKSIGAGFFHTCAITQSGAVSCWGDDSSLQLGTPPVDPRTLVNPLPAVIPGLPARAIQLALGADHTCMLAETGAVLCWGFNGYGQSGGATYTQTQAPLVVLPGHAVAIAAGTMHTCALIDDGTVKCWGANTAGQLGVDPYEIAYTYEPTTSPFANVVAITAGGNATCARFADGNVACLGSDYSGELGDGLTGGYATSPRKVLGDGAFSQIDLGSEHACGLRTSGSVDCWGANWFGVLGTDTPTLENWAPVTAATKSESSPIVAVTSGAMHTCAFHTSGRTQCWGSNSEGQLGRVGDDPLPDWMDGVHAYSSVDAGGEHTCAIGDDRKMQCWGDGEWGQLGTGDIRPNGTSTPVDVVGSGLTFVATGTGYQHSCGLTDAGEIYCWGDNTYGQTGNGAVLPGVAEPTAAKVALGGAAIAIGIGGYQSCALLADHSVACWGAIGAQYAASTPQAIDTLYGAVELAAGGTHVCARFDSGSVACLGQNDQGQLGRSDTPAPHSEAALVEGLPATATALAAGDDFTCALLSTGDAYCWGSNQFGALGSGEAAYRANPERVDMPLLANGFE